MSFHPDSGSSEVSGFRQKSNTFSTPYRAQKLFFLRAYLRLVDEKIIRDLINQERFDQMTLKQMLAEIQKYPSRSRFWKD